MPGYRKTKKLHGFNPLFGIGPNLLSKKMGKKCSTLGQQPVSARFWESKDIFAISEPQKRKKKEDFLPTPVACDNTHIDKVI